MKHIEEFNEAKKSKKDRETTLINLVEDCLMEYTDIVVEKGNFYVQPNCYPINISWKGLHSTNSEYPLVFEENLQNAENEVKYIKAIKSMMVRIGKMCYKIDHLYFCSRNYGQQMQLSVKLPVYYG